MRKLTTLLWMSVLMMAVGCATNSGLQTRIVAHRGASYDAPENTATSFALAWKQDADAIEGDFYLTADGHIVCFHDRTTNRIAGVDMRVEDATLEQLQAMDVGRWKAPEFAGQRMPILAEVLDMVPPGKMIYLDIKSGPHIVAPMRDIIRQSGLRPEQVVVIAFNADVIAKTRELMPELKTYWLSSFRQDKETGIWTPSLETVLATLTRIDAHGLSSRGIREVVDADFVRAIRAAGFEYHTWTINDADLARYFYDLGADSITTDRPGYIREALTAYQKQQSP